MTPSVPDPSEKAVTPDRDDAPATPSLDAAEDQSSTSRRSPLIAGQRWRTYQVSDPIDCDTGWCYRGVNVGMLEDVIIRVQPRSADSEMRGQAWEALESLKHGGLVRGIEACEEGDYRYEISQPPPESTLKEWASCRQATLEDVQQLMQQLATIVAALHERGVVHLNLRPDTIYMLPADSGLHVAVGGLDHATIYNQPGLIPAPVDTLYAPPEAAGLAKHAPGAGLRAWDWWSLGRVMQEIVLGRHVITLMVNREVARHSAELRSRAEALLLERDPQAPRAGAVELMPPMSQPLTDLMRGLLASSRDGRWGIDEVQRWLNHQPVHDRYNLGRNEELFTWKDKRLTVEEAAEFFSRKENWDDGVHNLFGVDDPTSLAAFCVDRTNYRATRATIEELQNYVNLPNWAGLPQPVLQSVVAAAAWLALGGENTRLMMHGRRVDAACLGDLLKRDATIGVATLRAMTAVPFIKKIERADPEASRMLSALAATLTSDVIVHAAKNGWINADSTDDNARLFLLALEQDKKLMTARDELVGRYACTRDAGLQELFAKTKLSRQELVLLNYAGAQPERFSFVTHKDWNLERYGILKAQGERISTALFWLRMERAMRSAGPVLGRWPVVLAVWSAAAVLVWRLSSGGNGQTWAFATFGAALALRASLSAIERWIVRKHAPSVQWGWAERPSRCREEANTVFGGGKTLHTAKLAAELADLNAKIAALAISPRPAPVSKPGWILPLWSGSIAGWTLLIAAVLMGDWRLPPTNEEIAEALFERDLHPSVRALELSLRTKPDVKPSTEELFFAKSDAPLLRWDLVKPADAPRLKILKLKEASSDQIAVALVEGQKLLMPYARESVNTLIAVPVLDDEGPALVLYDGRHRRVVARRVVVPEQLPSNQSWFKVGQMKVYFFGAAAERPDELAVSARRADSPEDLSERETARLQRDVISGRLEDRSEPAGEPGSRAAGP